MIWARYRRPLLFLVYFLFFFHTALWHYWGYEGVGHLGFGEFFGSMRTGIITAGTVFSIVVFCMRCSLAACSVAGSATGASPRISQPGS